MTAVLNDISEGPALEPVQNQVQDRDPPKRQVQSLGDLLRSKREARGLTSKQAAEQLRLLPHWIDAFESNRFDALVAPVYSRGYLRKYAVLLELPPEEILARYEKLHDIPPTPALTPITPSASTPVRASRAPAWLGAAAFAAVGVALVITQMDGDGEASQEAQAQLPAAVSMMPIADPPTQVTTAPVPDSELPAAVPVEASVGPQTSAPESSGSEASVTAPPIEAAPQPALLTPATPAEEAARPLEVSSESAATTEAPPVDPPLARLEVPMPGNGQMLNLKLSFKGKSWTTVYASDGTRLLYELSRRGRPRSVSSRAPLTVIVGDIDAVEMRVNDKVVTIPREPGKDSIKFILDVEGTSGGDARSAADVGTGG